MYALESAMDELAVALGMDPVELRVVNEPGAHGPGERAAVQLAEPRRLPARGRGPLRLGRA